MHNYSVESDVVKRCVFHQRLAFSLWIEQMKLINFGLITALGFFSYRYLGDRSVSSSLWISSGPLLRTLGTNRTL
jgi:hypothetical protein